MQPQPSTRRWCTYPIGSTVPRPERGRWFINWIGQASPPPLTSLASDGHGAGPAQAWQQVQDLAADGHLGMSHRVISPRLTRAWSYAAQLVTRYRVLYFGCTREFMPEAIG
jgi:hypothetical protein